MFEEIFGLPLHPLAVHAVVVVVPVATLATIAVTFWVPWRRFVSWVVALNAVSVVLTYVARESGKEFYAALGGPALPNEAQDHRDFGLMLIWYVLAFFGLSVLSWLLAQDRSRGWLANGAYVLTAAAAAVALYWVIRVGHTGTDAVWGNIVF